MELHVIHAVEKNVAWHWLVPLRTKSSGLFNGLKTIAASLPSGESEEYIRNIHTSVVLGEVRALLTELDSEDIQATHWSAGTLRASTNWISKLRTTCGYISVTEICTVMSLLEISKEMPTNTGLHSHLNEMNRQ
jgi:hypothetical protein